MIDRAIRSLSETETIIKTVTGIAGSQAGPRKSAGRNRRGCQPTHQAGAAGSRATACDSSPAFHSSGLPLVHRGCRLRAFLNRSIISPEQRCGIESSYFVIEGTNNPACAIPLRALRFRAYPRLAAASWQGADVAEAIFLPHHSAGRDQGRSPRDSYRFSTR
jgi:hypothetical protein